MCVCFPKYVFVYMKSPYKKICNKHAIEMEKLEQRASRVRFENLSLFQKVRKTSLLQSLEGD